MEPHRLRAPSTDGALLAEPPLDHALALLASNHDRLSPWEYDFQGRLASRLRETAQKQVLDSAADFLKASGLDVPALPEGTSARLVVTGHQPELFHPGVWVKNFAASYLAERAGAVALNLIVDNDIPKAASIKVPRVDGPQLRAERVAFDEWVVESPYEDLKVHDEALFASFAGRARSVLPEAIQDPILADFWPRAIAARRVTANVGLRFAIARRGLEAAWGVHNFEVPLGAVCESEAFLWFTSHILAQLPSFQRIHNDALKLYRQLYGIRSRHHPVPALGAEGEWREAPFWVWRASKPRRHPLLARQLAKTMQIRIGGEDEILAELPLSPDREACCAVELLRELPSRGVRLRSRALTTTMFARYLLGDLFLHGIGGAKYDELGDAISGRFFGIEPPAYSTLSLTLWLGLDADPTARARLAIGERELRDLSWNPDRHLGSQGDPTALRWVEAKRKAVLEPAGTAAEKLERFRHIRRCNEALQGHIDGRRQALEGELGQLKTLAQRGTVAQSREFAAVLHSRQRFQHAIEHALPGIRLAR